MKVKLLGANRILANHSTGSRSGMVPLLALWRLRFLCRRRERVNFGLGARKQSGVVAIVTLRQRANLCRDSRFPIPRIRMVGEELWSPRSALRQLLEKP